MAKESRYKRTVIRTYVDVSMGNWKLKIVSIRSIIDTKLLCTGTGSIMTLSFILTINKKYEISTIQGSIIIIIIEKKR